MTSSLKDQVAVVTGGASGIGEACCRALAGRGAHVVVADLDESRAEAVAATLPHTIAAQLDVTDHAALQALADRLGPVDILITSAGVLQRPARPEDLTMAEWDHVVAVDQRGVYLTCLVFGTAMARRGRGAIVNIASVAALRSMPLHAYAPAKAAVVAMTAGLAAEWGRSGVRVNAVAPGFVLTPGLQAEAAAGRRDITALAQNAAIGRLVEADEIARGCCFLASGEASAITGVTLPIDAGWLVAGSWAGYGGVPGARGC